MRVVRVGLAERERLLAVARRVDRVAGLAQALRHRLRERLVVLDEQHPHDDSMPRPRDGSRHHRRRPHLALMSPGRSLRGDRLSPDPPSGEGEQPLAEATPHDERDLVALGERQPLDVGSRGAEAVAQGLARGEREVGVALAVAHEHGQAGDASAREQRRPFVEGDAR